MLFGDLFGLRAKHNRWAQFRSCQHSPEYNQSMNSAAALKTGYIHYFAFPFPSVLWLHNFTAASLWAAAGRWILACGLHKSWYLVEKCLGKEFSNVLCFRKRLLKTSQVSQLLRNDQNSSIAPTSFALTLRKTLNCSYNKWLFPSWLLAWSQSGIAREDI